MMMMMINGRSVAARRPFAHMTWITSRLQHPNCPNPPHPVGVAATSDIVPLKNVPTKVARAAARGGVRMNARKWQNVASATSGSAMSSSASVSGRVDCPPHRDSSRSCPATRGPRMSARYR